MCTEYRILTHLVVHYVQFFPEFLVLKLLENECGGLTTNGPSGCDPSVDCSP